MENATLSPPASQDSSSATPVKTPGGWKAIKYILGNEAFEKLASMSLQTNMTLYLKTKYNLGGILLVNVVNISNGSTNLATLLGAILSDSYLGRSRTILLGSLCSFIGMALITLTAAIPGLRPSHCNGESHCPQPHSWQLGFLFVGLAFIALGAGGIRPCNIAFGADQFDITTEKGKKQLESFCNYWYLSFTVALFISLTTVLYIQSNVSWVLGYAIPTAFLAFSITIFLVGYSTFILKKPEGSIFTDMAKVTVAACRKCRVSVGETIEVSFYDPPMTARNKETTILTRTERFKFLDKAAIVTNPGEVDDQGKPKSCWRLCSLQQVEKLKCLLGIVPVWVTGLGCFMAMDQQGSYGILQAIQMNRKLGSHFKIPPAWLNITSMIALSIWISVYEGIYIPHMKRLTGKEKRLTMQQRIRTGIVFSILAMISSGVVERMRRDSANKHGSFVASISVIWLLPQFVLSGLVEAFSAIAMMEFFTQRLPDCMKAVAGAIFFLSLSIASYTSSLISTIIHNVTGKNGNAPWVGLNDLNQGRLEYYYYIVAGIGTLNFIYFHLFASRFVTCISERKEVQLDNMVPSNTRDQAASEFDDQEKGLAAARHSF